MDKKIKKLKGAEVLQDFTLAQQQAMAKNIYREAMEGDSSAIQLWANKILPEILYEPLLIDQAKLAGLSKEHQLKVICEDALDLMIRGECSFERCLEVITIAERYLNVICGAEMKKEIKELNDKVKEHISNP